MKVFCRMFSGIMEWCLLLQILGGNVKACGIPSDNVGYKLLTKMGWTGGSVGKNSSGEAPRLPPVVRFEGRAGLGCAQSITFPPAVSQVIGEFVQSGGNDDLVFSSELTSEEQDIIFAEARKNCLRCRLHSDGEKAYVVVSVHRTPMELVNYLLENGGENNKYRLLKPSTVHC